MNGLVQFVPILVWAVILAFPLVALVRRVGLSAWWNVVQVVPLLGGMVLLYIVAFRHWPARDTPEAEG